MKFTPLLPQKRQTNLEENDGGRKKIESSLLSLSCNENSTDPVTMTDHIMTSAPTAASHQGEHILVTGGCGYIGSHTIVCLLEQGYNVVVVDNLVNSSRISLDRVTEIAQIGDEERKERLVFHEVDLCDRDALRTVFQTSPRFQACIHFAGLKVRGISIRKMKIRDGTLCRYRYCWHGHDEEKNPNSILCFRFG